MQQKCLSNHNGKRRFWQHASKTVWAANGRVWIFPALSSAEWEFLFWLTRQRRVS
jgi:hypothetical protein